MCDCRFYPNWFQTLLGQDSEREISGVPFVECVIDLRLLMVLAMLLVRQRTLSSRRNMSITTAAMSGEVLTFRKAS